MSENSSKDIQQILNQAQLYQQQMHNMMQQKESLNVQLIEISKALEELEKTTNEEVYKIAGPILVKSKSTEVKKDLREKEEIIKSQLKTIESGEKRIREKLDDLRDRMSGSADSHKKKVVAE